MFKKLLIASAVLVASSSVFAANYKGDYKGEAPAPCPTYSYQAGPYLGLSAGVLTNGTGTPTYYKGIQGLLSAGYGAMLSPVWYLAGEIFGGGSAKVKDYKDQATNTNGVKTSWTWGASVLPGYMITDHVLMYLRLGGTQSRFSDQGVNKTGWHVGLGGQTNIYQNWDLRGEYVYTQYGSVSGIGKPLSDQFNLGVVYKFV